SSCSPLHKASLSNINSEATKVISITDFFYDDPTIPYVALPDHKLDQSPCCPIIAIKVKGDVTPFNASSSCFKGVRIPLSVSRVPTTFFTWP
ncbi:MAG: hypothetical protein WA631_10675, partial [Nitrososphaeraceae archaeon]